MSKQSTTTASRRITAAVAASVATLASAAILATTGSAQTQPPTTLHLLSRMQQHVGFFPNHPPRPGDQFAFGDSITGDDTGYSRIVCTLVGRPDRGIPCMIWIHLSKGNLTAQGLLPERARNAAVTITGGTGAYNGARGTAYATDISQTSSRITVQLLP